MKVVLYTHSLVSDWNHGNAHFLRGVLRELEARGHETLALEPADSWSRANLLAERGQQALDRFATDFPELTSRIYDEAFDHEAALDDADLVLVHEWTDPSLVARIGRIRRDGGRFTLAFHDTHHRAVSAEKDIADLALVDYDLVLAFGETLRERYLARGWGRQVHTWHEAADTRLFKPLPLAREPGSLIFVGNWGDGERTAELDAFLMEPVKSAGIAGTVRGVRYPQDALARLAAAGLSYGGSIANVEVPAAFAQHGMTIHVPRRPYVEALPGIPTIRVFEALACGIPLVSAPRDDAEGLFREGDFVRVADTAGATAAMRMLAGDPQAAAAIAASGLETILTRHSCAHRVDQLLAILGQSSQPQPTELEEMVP